MPRSNPWYRRVLIDHPELREATPEQIDAIFRPPIRDIADVVRDGRPYTYYPAGDVGVGVVLDADPRLKVVGSWVRWVVDQRPGLVMHRDTWPSADPKEERILASQLRPFRFKELGRTDAMLSEEYPDFVSEFGGVDNGVFMKWRHHAHSDLQEHQHLGKAIRTRVVGQDGKVHAAKPKTPAANFMLDHKATAHEHDPIPDGVWHDHPWVRVHLKATHGGIEPACSHRRSTARSLGAPPTPEGREVRVSPEAPEVQPRGRGLVAQGRMIRCPAAHCESLYSQPTPSLSLPSRPRSDPSMLTGPSHRPDRRQIHPRNSRLEA